MLLVKDSFHVTTPAPASAALMPLISGQIMREMRDLRLITDQSELGRGRRWPIPGRGAGGDGRVVVCVTADQTRWWPVLTVNIVSDIISTDTDQLLPLIHFIITPHNERSAPADATPESHSHNLFQKYIDIILQIRQGVWGRCVIHYTSPN